ncbi:MAG: preprotein translocase subunit SecE [Anaerolineaceae bacterium]|jgi:preprotein translocase subunit SecE|nr:preprotein translocase subunit SecE [Chloroflexota bacterium]HZK17615.1 preprotein translocase subunit SecE [Anaerolineaceae bacterium]
MAQKEKKPNLIQKTKTWWRQTIGELRKVTWPTREEALALTRIVLIVTVIMSAILGVLDFVFARLIGLLVG